MRDRLAQAGRYFAQQSWSLASSSNYSHRIDNDLRFVSRTGVDKWEMQESDYLITNSCGKVLYPTNGKSSAETLIHTLVYSLFPDVNCVLHTHSVCATRLSMKFEKELVFTGYEIQKALRGFRSHEERLVIPIIDNSQDMVSFTQKLKPLLEENRPVAFLMRGHGLYTWAEGIVETRRQVEALEFLFECLSLELRGV